MRRPPQPQPQPQPQPRTGGPPPTPARSRLLVTVLALVVFAQAAVLVWWWLGGASQPAAAPIDGSITVTSAPAGASVSVDGVRRGETPLTLDLAPGLHSVIVAQGATPWSQTVEVKPGQPSSIHVAQAAPPPVPVVAEGGVLEITTEPPGLMVAVDGQPRGPSPVAVTGLEPGSHEIVVTRGAAIVRRTVSVEAGVPTAVLISTTSAGISSGWLTVTGPVPVQIMENGTLLGTSDAPRLLLPVGTHELEFVSEPFGYRERRVVQITNGQAAAVALEPASGTLSVNAQPWGEVWIDGQRIGETPIGNLSLAIGNHELVVRHPQLGERRRTVAVSAGAPTRIGLDLRQP